MASNPASELASTLQSASINHHPDPAYDASPSTTASRKSPVRLRSHLARESSTSSADDLDAEAHSRNNEVPLSVLEQPPRKSTLPPLPDLRFEQSYLARIRPCQSYWSVAWVTFLDQVLMPLSQGVVWNLAVFGWRAFNTDTKFHGQTVGARVRRWWWGVNNWKVPDTRF